MCELVTRREDKYSSNLSSLITC
uniref:Uncharacterized protein n=1 Tax=Arundo donax TaxID=35708 RepID=A0A0A9T8S5_ARUDO